MLLDLTICAKKPFFVKPKKGIRLSYGHRCKQACSILTSWIHANRKIEINCAVLIKAPRRCSQNNVKTTDILIKMNFW